MKAYLQFGTWGGPYQTVEVEHRKGPVPLNRSVSGYGSQLPTQHMIKHLGRWRRVYAVCWSNVATLYAMVMGEKIVVQIDDY